MNEIRQKFDAWTNITITLASLAAAASRASSPITNASNRGRAKVLFSPETGAVAPTAETIIELFLLEQDDSAAATGRTDGWTGADAAITINNAKNLGALAVPNTANVNVTDCFDTSFVATLNTDGWGIAVRNGMNQAMNATEGNHKKRFQYFLDEIQ
jgi:hypothetical protein